MKKNQPHRRTDVPELSTSEIHMRVTQAEKAAWTKAAGGQKLSEFIRQCCNNFVKINGEQS